jgi:cytochrome c-type biogenesis protein CcmH/NrfG
MVPGYAESTPLAVLVQTGLVGLGVLAAACGVAIRDRRRSLRPVSRPNAAAIAAGVTVALFHDLLTADPVLVWWAALAGAAAAVSSDAPRAPETGDRRWPVWAAAAAWIVLWGVVQPSWARARFGDDPPTTGTVERWQRAEPWDDVPLRRRVSALLGEPTWRWRDAAEALATAERAVTVHPGSAAVWSDLGRVRTRIATELGDPTSVGEARRALERATRLDPWVPWTWLEMARLERATGRIDAARSLVSRALEAEPATVRAWLFAARLELDRGRPEAARRAFDTAVELLSGRGDPNLSVYERQLLAADPAEVAEIESSL